MVAQTDPDEIFNAADLARGINNPHSVFSMKFLSIVHNSCEYIVMIVTIHHLPLFFLVSQSIYETTSNSPQLLLFLQSAPFHMYNHASIHAI